MVHAVPDCGFAKTYIISDNGGLAVVDVGSVATATDVAAYIKNQPGMSLDMIRYITATHFHIDHIGGIGHLLARCLPETKVLFHCLVKDYLEGKRKLSLISKWCAGFLPAMLVSFRYVKSVSHLYFESLAGIPLPGIRNIVKLPYGQRRISYFGVEDGNTFSTDIAPGKPAGLLPANNRPVIRRYPLGFAQWEVIETPGHTEDSVCFFNASSKELICGDLMVNMVRNGAGSLNRFCWDKKTIVQSYEALRATISAKTIYPGHGDVIRSMGSALENIKVFQA